MSFPHLAPIEAGGSTGIPEHIDTRPDVRYKGPSMPWLIANQKLAHQIIATHSLPEDEQILDDKNMDLLRRYAQDPSPAGVEQLLRNLGLWNEQDGAADGMKVRDSGNLVVHAMLNGGFDEADVKMLNEWFENGSAGDKL